MMEHRGFEPLNADGRGVFFVIRFWPSNKSKRTVVPVTYSEKLGVVVWATGSMLKCRCDNDPQSRRGGDYYQQQQRRATRNIVTADNIEMDEEELLRRFRQIGLTEEQVAAAAAIAAASSAFDRGELFYSAENVFGIEW